MYSSILGRLILLPLQTNIQCPRTVPKTDLSPSQHADTRNTRSTIDGSLKTSPKMVVAPMGRGVVFYHDPRVSSYGLNTPRMNAPFLL